ncbi:U3 small nucleolar RNA-associated protein 6-domain-containing protein [Boeremia exigua]|uniref:U3 small nucleolar RNA-associated protein 6-domain-containing protein n=1 Tax=Boeremia exigua TaxID=749465 RepID=UPI001E8DF16D|nr:U3 small nucleolar RNA-associated protein 6-domain-containing protein [Boeremia exigua]KAH6637773.1 U3 small nucleolar RNA-associated protein 6-domain-containing protein [Boeremia exigua]
MAGPSDKARFFLEQSATELNELERKKIFTRDEIKAIAKKRSDFEHIINARGSHPSDYMRYIEFEKNVDALRQKRTKRLGIRHKGAGQRSIYFLYNRATKKFSGDLTLWLHYIEFARKDKAYRRLSDIFTSVVRLHPTKPELWTLAANYFMGTQADITNARSYMQRGLRFCKNSEEIWLDYAKLETIYVGKIAGRRKILGLDIDRTKKQPTDDEDTDMIALPDVTAEDINPSLKQDDGVDEVALQNLASAPVLTGAIPLAIFDSAMKQFQNRPKVVEKFFNMFAEFDQLACIPRILQHVLDYLQQAHPKAVENAICQFQMQLFGQYAASPEFPVVLGDAFDAISSAIDSYPSEVTRLAEVAVRQLLTIQSSSADVDPALQKAIRSTLRKYLKALGGTDGDRVAGLARALVQEGKRDDAQALLPLSIKTWSANEELQEIRAALET